MFVSVGRARRHTAEVVRSWALGEVTETAELLASELVTNAIKASIAPDGRSGQGRDAHHDPNKEIALRLASTGTSLVIEVWDHDDTAPMLEDQDLMAEGGRGLLLVDVLSNRWAYYRPRRGGKVVWCEVDLPETPTRGGELRNGSFRTPRRQAVSEPGIWASRLSPSQSLL
jgi:anti-sigma regulatory factor (Ser/Thr protein kinase)